MTSSSSAFNPLDRLAEEFVERYRRGEQPLLTEYTRNHPDLAEEIRELFPALIMMEHIRLLPGEASGIQGEGQTGQGCRLDRVGEYNLLRQVGHGGMGIVYEAEQQSLGRHVALKVLHGQALLHPHHVERFHREARAAARLHHTNIVPVFGVGEDNGMHYYVMQFIRGLSLDQVLTELRRLRLSPPRPQAGSVATPSSAEELGINAITQSLLAGRFPGVGVNQQLEHNEKSNASNPDRAKLAGNEERQPAVAGTTCRLTGASSIHLPGQPEGREYTSGRQFWQSVARVGIQVAEALAYANGQGILHRDIKPSNLLLDEQGTVWITDFGLAKALSEEERLTHTGDIVGTL